MSEKLLPCPCCGSDDLSVVPSCDFIACNDCGIQIEDGDPNATVVWNRRDSALPAQTQITEEQIARAILEAMDIRDGLDLQAAQKYACVISAVLAGTK